MAASPQRQEATFSLGDLVRILRRRIWWFALPSGVGMAIALGVALGLPPVYEAATTILIEPATIREDIVQSTVVTDKESRFQQTRLRLFARDSLAAVIDEFELYADDSAPMEKLIARMRGDITIEPILPQVVDPRAAIEINSVRVAFRSAKPKLSAEVANRLARDYIRVNLEARAADAQGTSDFLESELVREEVELGRILQQVSDFKEQHVGELPEQLTQNRVRLERLLRDQTYKRGDLEGARNQIALIQRQFQEIRGGADNPSDPLRRKVALEQELVQLRDAGYTEKHPDVRMIQAQLAGVAATLEEAPAQEEQRPPMSHAETKLMDELRNNEVKVNVLSLEVERLAEEIATVESRLENTPKRAAELAQLEARARSHEDAITHFRAKKAMADIARSLESKQKGEKFRVIESAEPPREPVSPNRPLVFVVGAALGLLTGIALLVVREVSDSRVHTIDELHQALPLPVLAAVPVIRLPSEIAEMRARVRRWGLSGAAAVVLALLIGGAVWMLGGEESPATAGAPAETASESGDV
jgi:succinoglycan biosynthesis transport protein ExoP